MRVPGGTSIQSGFIKVERRNNSGVDGQPGTIDDVWTDVTADWLALGFTKRNIDALNAGTLTPTCAEPNPNAILRFQRVRADIDATYADVTVSPCKRDQ